MIYFQCLVCKTFTDSLRSVREYIDRAHTSRIKNGQEEKKIGPEMLHIKKVTFVDSFIKLRRLPFIQKQNKTLIKPVAKPEAACLEKFRDGKLILKRRTGTSQTCKFCAKTFPYKKLHDIHVQMVHLKSYDIRRLCVFCGKACLHYRDVEEHYRKHTLEQPFFCNVCGYELTSEKSLPMHMETHDTNRQLNFECDLCPKKFFTRANLYQHKRTHLREERNTFRCKVCDKGFSCRRNLRIHLETHKEEKDRSRAFRCEICQKTFFNHERVKKHMPSHDDQRPFFCKFCKACFKTETGLNRHVKEQHNENRVRKFSCHLCPKTFFTKAMLSGHIKIHSGIRPFECNLCSSAFQTRRGLKRHKLTVHDKLKQFQCEVCKAEFTLSQNLQNHLQKYKGECLKVLLGKIRPNENGMFQCSVCDKEFLHLHQFNNHVEIHEKNRKRQFSCHLCEDKFFTKCTLRSHLQVHNGHECRYCDMIFSSRGKKERHEATTHAELITESSVRRGRPPTVKDHGVKGDAKSC